MLSDDHLVEVPTVAVMVIHPVADGGATAAVVACAVPLKNHGTRCKGDVALSYCHPWDEQEQATSKSSFKISTML